MERFIEMFITGESAYMLSTILVFITMIFALLMSANVKLTFSKYDKIKSRKDIPAYAIARQILDSNGLQHVQVIAVPGKLTDHYDPRKQIVALSESVCNNRSVSAIGVAAHECGHAIQHAREYTPVKMRTAIFPVVNIANRTWIFLILIGMFLPLVPGTIMINFGIVFFTLSALFSLITLPVEFDASKRAMATISAQNILDLNEQKGAKKTLSAAAMTYVAALLISIAQLLRILAIAARRR